MRNSSLLMLTAGTMLAGCGWLAPSFELPKVAGESAPLTASSEELFVSPTVVGSWQLVDHAELAVSGTAPWYSRLDVPGLDEVMKQALAENPNLKVMAGRVKQARAEAGIALAAMLPSVTAQGDVTRGRSSPSQLGLPQGSVSKEGTIYGAGLGASFELDLFGRLSGESRTSRLIALSEQDLYDDLKLVLEGDVVRTVVLTRTTREVAEAWKILLAEGEQRHAIIDARYKVGEVAVGDWQASFSSLQDLRAGALSAAADYEHARGALAILVGKVPQEYVVPESILVGELKTAPAVPEGISSTVLLQRPDVQAAAHQLEAANEQIGVARAAFFPRISLTGNGGFASSDFSNLFDWNNRTWAAGPVVSLPIFQGGALRANLKRSWAIYEQNVAQYRAQALEAFRDVNDAMTDARTTRLQADSFSQALEGAMKADKAMSARYGLGDVGKLEMLTSNMASVQARITLAQARYASYAGIVRFMQAIGAR